MSFYQFATIFGIMLSFWIGYASNNIGGQGDTQSNLAWQLPTIIQGIPAVCLALGIWWLPFSPRWLIKQDRDDEAITTLAYLRNLPTDNELIQVEYKEIKAECLFEERHFAKSFPTIAAKEKKSVWTRQLAEYYNIIRSWDNAKRVATAWLVMFFQQVSTPHTPPSLTHCAAPPCWLSVPITNAFVHHSGAESTPSSTTPQTSS